MNMNKISNEELNSFISYNYIDNLKRDILNYIIDNELFSLNFDDLLEHLWIADSVTGNGSGSYTFSRLNATLNLVGNFDLIKEMIDNKFIDSNNLEPEVIDVSIRCYLLNDCLDEVLNSDNYLKAYNNFKKGGK